MEGCVDGCVGGQGNASAGTSGWWGSTELTGQEEVANGESRTCTIVVIIFAMGCTVTSMYHVSAQCTNVPFKLQLGQPAA